MCKLISHLFLLTESNFLLNRGSELQTHSKVVPRDMSIGSLVRLDSGDDDTDLPTFNQQQQQQPSTEDDVKLSDDFQNQVEKGDKHYFHIRRVINIIPK
jgi:hypothetical protein